MKKSYDILKELADNENVSSVISYKDTVIYDIEINGVKVTAQSTPDNKGIYGVCIDNAVDLYRMIKGKEPE